jgi:hypothetical protein
MSATFNVIAETFSIDSRIAEQCSAPPALLDSFSARPSLKLKGGGLGLRIAELWIGLKDTLA